jgi:hypothetical protein
MNGLEFILILLVPLIVWILSTVFKGDGDRPGSSPGSAARPQTQRRPVTDLDRFLEEARRRREAAERGQQANAETQQRPVPPRETRPAPMPERRPVRPPTPPRRRNVDTVPPQPVRAPVLLEAVADAPATNFPAPRVDALRPEPVRVEGPVPLPVPSPALSPLFVIRSPGTRPAPALVKLAELLSSPRTAGTAIILKEIFDRPLSRRRR